MATLIANPEALLTSGISSHSAFGRSPSFKRGDFVSLTNGVTKSVDLSSKLQISRKLSPLQISRTSKFTHQSKFSIYASAGTPKSTLAIKQEVEVLRTLNQMLRLSSPDRTYLDKRHPYADLQVGERWKEIHGANNWEGLLEDMDPVLRGEVIRYGEFAEATYDAFDHDETSEHCGNSRYSKNSLLKEVGLENRGYEITDFIYATADMHLPKIFQRSKAIDNWSKDSNFMGFVAVCTSPREIARLGRRDVVVAWRGTVTKLEWVENVRDHFSPTGLDPRGEKGIMVESGFLSVYKSSNEKSRYNKQSARRQVLEAVKKLVQTYKDEDMSITVTGHSLGSALSLLCAYDIVESGINKRAHSPRTISHWDAGTPKDTAHHHESPCDNPVPVSVFSFAGPRLGNLAFKQRLEELGVKVLRVVNKHDQVPNFPGLIFNEKMEFLHQMNRWLPSAYHHVGVEIQLDNLKSGFLRHSTDPLNAHNLEVYLHLMDGYGGSDDEYCSALGRDPALVNKCSDFLNPALGIPAFWWEEQKENLVRDSAGKLMQRKRVDDSPFTYLAAF